MKSSNSNRTAPPSVFYPVAPLAASLILLTGCGDAALVIAELIEQNGAETPPENLPEPPMVAPAPPEVQPEPSVPVPLPVGCAGQLMGVDDVMNLIQFDILSQDNDDRPFTRYLLLTNRFNAGVCSEDLALDRLAMNKALNLLSIETRVTNAFAIDAEQTIYRIDLRDYGWDRDFEVLGELYANGWAAAVAHNPLALEYQGDEAEMVILQSGENVPWMSADAFARVAVEGQLYYAFTGVDPRQTIEEFRLNELAVDVENNLSETEPVRAGSTQSSLYYEHVLAERHNVEVRAGALWQYFPLTPTEGMFDEPLLLRGEDLLTEAAYTLPNGMLAFLMAASEGEIVSAVPAFNNGFAVTRTIPSFLSNFSAGFPVPRDEVLDFVLANRFIFNADDFEAILDVYPSAQDLANLVADDNRGYLLALEILGIDPNDPDPVTEVIRRYEQPLDLTAVAAELGVASDLLLPNIALLDPRIQLLSQPGALVARDDFEELFEASVCTMQIFSQNQPLSDSCEDALDIVSF